VFIIIIIPLTADKSLLHQYPLSSARLLYSLPCLLKPSIKRLLHKPVVHHSLPPLR